MKLASLKQGRDGRLVVVSDDLAWYADASAAVMTTLSPEQRQIVLQTANGVVDELGIAEARGYGGGDDEHSAQGEGAHEEWHSIAGGSHDTDPTGRDRDSLTPGRA